ncbi:copper-binding protein [Edaphovirga cremea]|uniref:copper-binding protein n=1 Tax=Edaphovirga cremea TaxID=2267246 RepID=UPI000DEFFE1C|nr:copper-binding protein [Edaphovirga cremea]
MRALLTFLIITFAFSSPYLLADTHTMDHSHHAMPHGMSVAGNTSAIQSQGVIKKWQADRVTLAHPAIPELNWPPMTMTFLLPTSQPQHELPTGTAVDFSFVQTDAGYQLLTLTPASR